MIKGCVTDTKNLPFPTWFLCCANRLRNELPLLMTPCLACGTASAAAGAAAGACAVGGCATTAGMAAVGATCREEAEEAEGAVTTKRDLSLREGFWVG